MSNIVNNLECGVPLSEDLVARGMAADCEIFSKGDADKCRDDVEKALRTLTAGELFDLCAEESARFDVEMRSQLNADLCTRTGIRYVFERQVWRAKELLDPDVYVRNAFQDLRIADTDVISRLQFDLFLQALVQGEQIAPIRRHRRHAFAGVSLYVGMGVSFANISYKLLLSHSQNEFTARLRSFQKRHTSQLSSQNFLVSIFDDGEKEEGPAANPFESACRGEEAGRADMARWCAVYCGCSKPLIKNIRSIGKESGMHVEFEQFNW